MEKHNCFLRSCNHKNKKGLSPKAKKFLAVKIGEIKKSASDVDRLLKIPAVKKVLASGLDSLPDGPAKEILKSPNGLNMFLGAILNSARISIVKVDDDKPKTESSE